jgi:hypothetical protein
MERDKRNANASLPGADLVGFIIGESQSRLVLGEVKTSSEEKAPPQVMSGRSGHMGHQIDRLANNLSTIYRLLRWLFLRCKGTEYEEHYNSSIALYHNSGNKAVTLYGVLIRDTEVNESDLKGRAEALKTIIAEPTYCHLLALYLPFQISELPVYLKGGEA